MQINIKVTVTIQMLEASARDILITRLDSMRNVQGIEIRELALSKKKILENLQLRLKSHGEEGVYWWNEDDVSYSDEIKTAVEIHAAESVEKYWYVKAKQNRKDLLNLCN